MSKPPILVVLGSWEVNKSPGATGLGLCRWHSESGTLSEPQAFFPDIVVGCMARHPRLQVIYCTDETGTLPGYFRGGGGQVFALALHVEQAALTEINHTPSFGSRPCSVTVDSAGEYLLVTHHTGRDPVTRVAGAAQGEYRIAVEFDEATTVLFPLAQNGEIGPPCDVFRHTGSGGPLPRQTHPQLHSVTASPSGRLFVVCDKGNDELLAFRIDDSTSRLKLCNAPFKALPGSSPRYAAFHPTHPYLFVNHETKAVVSSIRYSEDGELIPVCTVSALPHGTPDGPNLKQSDLVVHPSGSALYTLVRGSDLVSVFAIDAATGLLERVQTVHLQGRGPRACALSPDGRFLLIAELHSNQISVWALARDGTLTTSTSTTAWQNAGSVLFTQQGVA